MERKPASINIKLSEKSPLVEVKDVSVRFGSEIVLDRINFSLHSGDKYALLGDNGAGKTTLLRVIMGDPLIFDKSGDVVFGKSARIGFVPQDGRYSGLTPEETVLEGFKKMLGTDTLEQRFQEISEDSRFKAGDSRLYDELGKIMAKMEALGGWDIEFKSAKLLEGFGLRNVLNHQVRRLSEVDQKRIFLARALINNPNLLFLDEPINHLDDNSQLWLAEYISNFKGATLTIAHDQNWLELFSNGVIDLNIHTRTATQYDGTIPQYLEYKESNQQSLVKRRQQLREEIDTHLDIWRRMRGNPTHAGTGTSHGELAKRLKGDLEKLGIGDKTQTVKVRFILEHPTGNEVLDIKGVKVAYPDSNGRVIDLSSISLELKRGDKLAFIGSLYSGRSTLLKTLAGRITPCSGNIRWGHNTRIGFLDQECGGVNPELTVYEYLLAESMGDSNQTLRNILAHFLFTGDKIDKKVGQLSGGERKRAALACLVLKKPNVLLLDEPTNDLDATTRGRLAEALQGYTGTILVVPTRLDNTTQSFLHSIGINKAVVVPTGEEKWLD